MPILSRSLLLLPALALLAACASPDRPPPPAATSVPPAPPPLIGALGAPIAAPARLPTDATGNPLPLSGGTTAPAPIAMPGAPTRLSSGEIASTLSNNTAEGLTTDGARYALYFSGDGQERFRQGAFTDVGTWRVLPDGRFCSSLVRVSNNDQQCYIMYRSGQNITFERPDGVTVGNVTVVPGNPEHL
jgi:hypothetical protein